MMTRVRILEVIGWFSFLKWIWHNAMAKNQETVVNSHLWWFKFPSIHWVLTLRVYLLLLMDMCRSPARVWRCARCRRRTNEDHISRHGQWWTLREKPGLSMGPGRGPESHPSDSVQFLQSAGFPWLLSRLHRGLWFWDPFFFHLIRMPNLPDIETTSILRSQTSSFHRFKNSSPGSRTIRVHCVWSGVHSTLREFTWGDQRVL